MTAPNYSSSLVWSDEDAAYVATCPEFPGLSGIDPDPAKALGELQEGIEMAIESLEEEGRPLPIPLRAAEHSGQIRLRMPRSLHGALAAQADREGVSLNTLLIGYLHEYLGRATGRVEGATALLPLGQDVLLRTQRDVLATRLDTGSRTL